MYVSQKDSATLAWLHFMREKEYTTSSNIATQEALHFNTDIPTATTLFSIRVYLRIAFRSCGTNAKFV